MSGRKFSQSEKDFRAMLRNGVCKDRLVRWFVDAGLNEMEQDVMYRTFLKKQTQEAIAMDTYTCRATISRILTRAINKLMDYFEYSGKNNTPLVLN